MSLLTSLQQKVFDEAKRQLQHEPWFKGICMDNFPTDEAIADNFADAVSDVVLETFMWDDPDFVDFGRDDDFFTGVGD
jgi:hypothetical protein